MAEQRKAHAGWQSFVRDYSHVNSHLTKDCLEYPVMEAISLGKVGLQWFDRWLSETISMQPNELGPSESKEETEEEEDVEAGRDGDSERSENNDVSAGDF